MPELTEEEAQRLVDLAVERAGGGHQIVGSPRHPSAMNASLEELVEGHSVIIHFGEASSPAIAEVEGWVFEIRASDTVMLDHPRRYRRRD